MFGLLFVGLFVCFSTGRLSLNGDMGLAVREMNTNDNGRLDVKVYYKHNAAKGPLKHHIFVDVKEGLMMFICFSCFHFTFEFVAALVYFILVFL